MTTSVALEEYELLGDSKYRNFVTAIDKALKTFEYSSEWADLISALGKLNKVLLSHIKFSVIPRRITISKRLAQCLHPALPSGVHLKALETYDIIFKCIGTARLSQELFIYSAGLFPLLGNAAMNVRPVLLTIYESHFVPLGERLRPGLLGFLIGVLPGLEEGSDHFERTDSLLLSVCDGVEQSFFYGCLWRCVLTNPGVRLPAITFVLVHLDKKKSMEDQLHLIGTDIDAMVRGMCAALQDASVLVQRCALDLLLLGFPLHNSQLVQSDRVQILEAAVSVVLRRDMSLNRRLFAWLLGTDSTSCPINDKVNSSEALKRTSSIDDETFESAESTGQNSVYFETYSKELLLLALRNLFLDAQSSLMLLTSSGHISGYPILWPYRILISLLDRSEIGSHILDDILIEVFRSLYREVTVKNDHSKKIYGPKRSKTSVNVPKFSTNHFEAKTNDFQKELVKTANLLFGTLEPSYLWEYVGKMFQKTCIECEIQDTHLHLIGEKRSEKCSIEEVNNLVGLPTIEELCKLISFLLDVISVETYQDTPTVHLPELLATIGGLLSKHCKVLTLKEFAVTFQLCSKLLSKAQPIMFTASNAMSSIHSRCKSTSSLDSNTTATSYSLSLRVETPKTPTSDQIGKDIEDKLNDSKADRLCWISLDLSPDPQEEDADDALLPNNYVLSKAVGVFQDFMAVFIRLKLLSNVEEITEAFQDYVVIVDKTSEREKELRHLLRNCLGNCTSKDPKDRPNISKEYSGISCLNDGSSFKKQVEISDDLANAFEGACQLLIELAAFPVYLMSRSTNRSQPSKSNACDMDPLPNWLKMLISVGCFLEERRIHLCALSTLLELVALTHAAISITNDSCNQSFKSFPSLSEETRESITCVVNIPMITENHLQFLTQRTQFFALAALKLWSHIGQAPSDQQLKSVDLLQQVHNLAPDNPCHGSVCDVVICDALSSTVQEDRMESLTKFCTLWHLTRDIRLKSNGGTALSRLFDRPLFLVLDQMGSEPGPLRTISESWLNHCLQRGDLARVLEPILMAILHQDTARVSVQHVSVYCPMNSTEEANPKKKVEDLIEPDEAQIYAISSVGGNVIYHVSGTNSCDSRPNSKQTSPEKKILALTSIVGADTESHSSKFITSHALIPGYELPCSHERNLNQPISLFVNPFGSMTSLSSSETHDHYSHNKIVPDMTNVRRINLKMFKKGDFDTMDSEESDDAEKKSGKNTAQPQKEPETVEEFARSILEDIITSVVEKDVGTQKNGDNTNNQTGNRIPDITETYQDKLSNSSPIIHPLHGYLLLYTQVYDSHKVLYMLSSLKSIIMTNPRLALWCVATTSVSQHSLTGSKGQDLQILLARHRKSIFGNNFHGSLTSEAVTTYRSSMFVEVIVTTCLYYIRGVYANLPRLQQWLTEDEVLGNRKVRLMALEVLTIVFSELVGIVKDGGRSVASYMNDLLNRCKVQKILLHCLTAGVFHSTQTNNKNQEPVSFSKVIIDFNEESFEGESTSFQDTLQVGLLHLISKVIILEDTIGWLTAIPAAAPSDGRESRTSPVNGTPSNNMPLSKQMQENKSGTEKSKTSRNASLSSLAPPFAVKYQIGVPLPAQPMFLTSILTALRQTNRCWLHSHWLCLVMASLPFTGGSGSKALSNLVISVVSQLCLSLDSLAKEQSLLHKLEINCDENKATSWPPDYLISMVESLTTICHFCLLDTPAAASTAVANATSGTTNTGGTSPSGVSSHSISSRMAISPLTSTSSYASGINASQIISNLLHVFSPSDILNKDFVLGPDGASGAGAALEALLSVRRTLLSNLPRIMATLTDLWRLIGETNEFQLDQDNYEKYMYTSLEEENRKKKHQQLLWTLGSPKVVKQHILSFLSPLSVHYGSHFMAAVAVVWHDYRPHKNRIPNSSTSSVRKIFPVWSHQQQQLVELVKAIKVLPFESIVQTVRQVLKQPPTTATDENHKRVPLEVSLLQFFLAYMQTSSGSTLVESWSSLLVLWREGLQLTSTPSSGSSSSNSNLGVPSSTTSSPLPIIQLHLLALLHEFVQKAPMLEDKRDQRDLQDVAQKLVDVCSEIAGSSLEQTNWLRRNLAVKKGPQPDLCDDDESDSQMPENSSLSESKSAKSDFGSNGSLSHSGNQGNSNSQYSVQALQCLAEFLAPIMDVVYVSEEKEKVVSLLNNIMYYVTPYLRNHSVHNTPSFRACSQILASISGYQYTRKAWKKDAFDLLLDSSFFQMEGGECLGFWRHIVDHLMTHDKMTFRDFLGRVCIPQTGSLSIFSSREQEYEQRAQLLKRLAFVIFCSELDQYQKYMPEIQERLAECLRLPQVPSVQANVFLCFRVLLLRMSPDHMTSLWPNIITEMVQVFLQMEQELSTETEQFRKLASSHIQRISLLDSSWVVHSGNGLHAHNNPAWLQLYLSVCKLLDMVICLPANMLPQFQMYRWAFVADSPPVSSADMRKKGERKIDSHYTIKALEQDFIPHIARLANLLNQKACDGTDKLSMENLLKCPILRMNVIKSVLQLQPFFNSLATSPSASNTATPSCVNEANLYTNGLKESYGIRDMLKRLESVLESDFIEHQTTN